MGSKSTASVALFLFLNLLSSSMVVSASIAPVPAGDEEPPSNSVCPWDVDSCTQFSLQNSDSCCNQIRDLPIHDAAVCLCIAIRLRPPIIRISPQVMIRIILNACRGDNDSDYDPCFWIRTTQYASIWCVITKYCGVLLLLMMVFV